MTMKMIAFAVLAACLGSRVMAQTATLPFHIVGHIQSFTLDPDCPANLLCGAILKANGITVTVPKNTIIWFPAAFLTPNDIFRWKGPDTAKPGAADHPVLAFFPLQTASGLALEDATPPLAAFEVDITGNIQPATALAPLIYIAGLIRISQQSLNTTDGYILGINTTTGELTVGPQGSTAGDPSAVKVRINDPEGRFGLQRNSYDWRFAVDDENSTIHSATGYPMCIPRIAADPECPASNRPSGIGGLLSRFTMGPVDAMNFLAPGAAGGPGVAPAPACPGCSANKQVPFAVGDRITFAGTLAKDSATGARYISAHTIAGWLGIYTQPGVDPAYLSIEVSLLATGGIPFPAVGQETGPGPVGSTRIKMEIVTTDPTRPVAAFAMDFVVPGGGGPRVATQRSLAMTAAAAAAARAKKNALIPSMTFAPSAKPPFGRLRLVVDRANFLPPPRELRVRFVGSTAVKTPSVANGVLANEYKAPLSEFIFPENLIFGQPAVPANFENLCFLFTGIGPLDTLGRVAGPVVGQLLPWPNSGHLTPESPCP